MTKNDDAFQNEWEIIIPPFPGVIKSEDTQIRVTGVNIPAFTPGKYTVDYKSQRATKPSGKIETTNELTFDFRVDKNWEVYKGFRNWINIIANHNSGGIGIDYKDGVPINRVDVTVLTIDTLGEPTGETWVFTGSWISNLAEIPFTYESGDPLILTVTLDFIKMID
jgi:hypothetical protein